MNYNMFDIKKRFLKFIIENNLINKNDGIVVGLSGGPDSICLLSLLNEIKDYMNINIIAAHVNHMLRGVEADADEEYARKMCEKMNIKFVSKKVDIKSYAKINKMSSESAGREARYDFFNCVLKKYNMNKIATAHNANDQAETVIMRMMRGTGLEGLGGILAKRDNIYIRPILFLRRDEIEAYCKKNMLNPRIDKTNLERIYSRNKIRLDILPYMKQNFNEDVIEAINRMALLLQEDNKYIEKKALDEYYNVVKEQKDKIIIFKEAFKLDKPILTRILRRAVSYISGNKYDLEMKHIFEIINLQNMDTGKQLDIPGNMYVSNVYKDIYIQKKCNNKTNESNIVKIYKDEISGKKLKYGEYSIDFEVICDKNINYQKNHLIKYFDYNIIEDSITIRTRKNGDKICPLGMHGSKKLKDIFIDMKVPKEMRDNIPIIQFDNDIAWIVSLKLSDKFKITSNTERILKITVNREV